MEKQQVGFMHWLNDYAWKMRELFKGINLTIRISKKDIFFSAVHENIKYELRIPTPKKEKSFTMSNRVRMSRRTDEENRIVGMVTNFCLDLYYNTVFIQNKVDGHVQPVANETLAKLLGISDGRCTQMIGEIKDKMIDVYYEHFLSDNIKSQIENDINKQDIVKQLLISEFS